MVRLPCLNASGIARTIGSAVTAGGSGAINLSTTGLTSDILFNANVGSTSGAISANAGGNVVLNAGNVSTTGNISLTSAMGTVNEAGAGILSGALLTTNSVTGTTLR